MRTVKTLASWAVPVGIALSAFLDARAVNALVEATVGPSFVTSGVAAAATAPPAREKGSADTILARNIFDSSANRTKGGDPEDAPSCDGVRPLVLVATDDPDVAFAAVDVGGKRLIRKKGDEVGGMKVAYVAIDRLWLERNGGLCEARLFGPRPLPANAPVLAPGPGTPGITTLSPTERVVDRSVVERLLDAQQELMKIRLVPEKEGMKVGSVKPGSALGMLGVETGDRIETINGVEVTSPEKMLEAYARLKSGVLDRVTVHVTRNGKGVNLDYQVR